MKNVLKFVPSSNMSVELLPASSSLIMREKVSDESDAVKQCALY